MLRLIYFWEYFSILCIENAALQELILLVAPVCRNLAFQVPHFQVYSFLLLHCSISCQYDIYSFWYVLDIAAVSTRKSKLKVVITGVSCGAFFLLLLGAIFMYRFHRVRTSKSKHDVFVDVAGIVGFSVVRVCSISSWCYL